MLVKGRYAGNVNPACKMSSSSKVGPSPRASTKSAEQCKIPLGRGPGRHDSLCSTTAALQQCNDLVDLQNTLLRDSLKRKKEVADQSVLERERYEAICKDLEVKFVQE